MNPEFNLKLGAANLSKKELADNLSMNPSTVYNWGDNPPKYAIAYLDLMIKSRLNEQLVDALDNFIEVRKPQ